MSYGKLLFAASISITIWCSSAVAQHTFNRDDGTFSAPNTTDTTFTASGSGAIQRYVDAHIKDGPINVKDFGASGSNTTTTGTISAGDTTLTLNAAIDFANNQGVRINHAGAAYALNPPTGLGVINIGTPGSTTYTYTVSCFDSLGGIDAALTPVATATGNGTLSTTNTNIISWTTPVGTTPAGCAIWGRASGSMALLALLPGNVTAWEDKGYAVMAAPDWLGATPPAAHAADWLTARVSSGAGTTTVVLTGAAVTAATAQVVAHDDQAAITNAMTALGTDGATLYFPAGRYNVHSYLSVGTYPMALRGAGWGSTYIASASPDQDIMRQISASTGFTSYSDMFFISDFDRTGGAAFDAKAGTYTSIDNIHTLRMFQSFNLSSNNVRLNNIDIRNTAPVYGVGIVIPTSNDQYLNNIVMDRPGNGEPKACIEITQNGGYWISNSDFIHCGQAGLLIDPQNGQYVKFGFVINTAFDTSSGDGIYLNPAAGGVVADAFFSNVWTATMGGHGFHQGATGTISNTAIVGHRSINNQKHCYFIEGGEISISSSTGTQCSLAGLDQYDGIAVTDATNVSLIGNRLGKTSGVVFSNQKYGIEFLSGGTVDIATVIGNDVSYNHVSGLHFAGTISLQQQMVGNTPATGEVNVNFGGTAQSVKAASQTFNVIGTVPTPSGTCSIDTQTGGATAGTFTANGACVGGTVILDFSQTAAHGFSCTTHNLTTPANLMSETATTVSQAIFTGSMANNDVVTFSCMGY